MIPKKGDIFYADLDPVVGSEQGGQRLVLIIQNDVGNKCSPTIIVAAITSQLDKSNLPTHFMLSNKKYNIKKDSIVLLEQIRTIDKSRLSNKITHISRYDMNIIDNKLKISLGII